VRSDEPKGVGYLIGADRGGLHDDCHHQVSATITENCSSDSCSHCLVSISSQTFDTH
jgi:hypothetical protein